MSFEYKIHKFDSKKFLGNLDVEMLEKELNVFGEESWELIKIDVNTAFSGAEVSAIAIMKREKV